MNKLIQTPSDISHTSLPRTPKACDASASVLLDSCYVFDIAVGAKFVISRDFKEKALRAESLYDIMTENGVHELLEYMKSYTDIPIFVSTTLGKALVVPSLAPSCALGVMIFASFKTDHLYRIAMRGGFRVKASRELTEGKRCRLNKSCLKFSEQSHALLQSLDACFSDTARNQLLTGDITDKLCGRIRMLSCYNAYPACVVCREKIVAVSDFDFSIFTAFVLVCILMARRTAPKARISFLLDMADDGIYVTAKIPAKRLPCREEKCLDKFKHIATQNNMPFECFRTEGELIVRFSPHPFDWAVLGFKSQDGEEENE